MGWGVGVLVGVGLGVLVGVEVVTTAVGVAPRDSCGGVGLAAWLACVADEASGRVGVDNMSSPPK